MKIANNTTANNTEINAIVCSNSANKKYNETKNVAKPNMKLSRKNILGKVLFLSIVQLSAVKVKKMSENDRAPIK